MPTINNVSVVTVTTAGATDVAPGSLRLHSIRWREATTAGHTCVVTDAAGVTLWESVAGGANYVEESDLLKKWPNGVNGLKVSTLESGEVDIYYRLLGA